MKPRTSWILSWLSYPLLILVAVAGQLVMMSSGLSVLVSTYVPLTMTAVAVSLLEFFNPARTDWRPSGDDILNDSLFMVIVQLILPKTIVFLMLIGVTQTVQSNGFHLSQLWPSEWPVALQALLMLLLADFFRYWLHRVSHSIPWLWAFHAVHHAPRILYWVNVGRFHPMDKVLQICVDVLPFVFLGVTEPVLALYFVFYATNGFLQHSSAYLRHGALNYVFSTAELHRWHHARDSATANCNFGNNLIIWDLLFGTRYLPEGREVVAIGIQDDTYPTDFVAQLKVPFITPATSRFNLESIDLARGKYCPHKAAR